MTLLRVYIIRGRCQGASGVFEVMCSPSREKGGKGEPVRMAHDLGVAAACGGAGHRDAER
jgi:hypothetical protein